LKGSSNVTLHASAANLAAANITAPTLTYTGVFTIVPDVAGTAFDFTTAAADIVGLDVFNISTADNAANTVILPAVTGGGTFTVVHSPTASASTGANGNLTVTQQGASTVDKLTVSLGAKSTGAGTGDILASGTDTLVISSAAAAAGTTTIDNITIGTGAATQSVTVSGAGTFALGDINADTVNTAGVGTAVTIDSLTNAIGSTTFIGGVGNTTITATGAANVTVTTGKGNDNVATNAGDDTIVTGEGTATINSGAGIDTITGGSGIDQITSGTGADTITLGAGVDVVTTTVGAAYTSVAADTVTDFTPGALGDLLQIDISDSTAMAATDTVTAGDGQTDIAGALAVKNMTAGTGITLATADEIVVIAGTLADTTALLASIGTGAGIITKSANNTTTNALLVVWNDGANTYVSAVSDAGTNAPMTTADLTSIDIITLTGVLTGFTTENFTAV
jgi:Ca2+-binding RTX toxin-like protein